MTLLPTYLAKKGHPLVMDRNADNGFRLLTLCYMKTSMSCLEQYYTTGKPVLFSTPKFQEGFYELASDLCQAGKLKYLNGPNGGCLCVLSISQWLCNT